MATLISNNKSKLISTDMTPYFRQSWRKHPSRPLRNASPAVTSVGWFKAACKVSSSLFRHGKIGFHLYCNSCPIGAVGREDCQLKVSRKKLSSCFSVCSRVFLREKWDASEVLWPPALLWDVCWKHCRKRTLASRELERNHLPNCVELKSLGMWR